MFCPACGKEISGSVKYCPNCGCSLQTASSFTVIDAADSEALASITSIGPSVSSFDKYRLILVSRGTASVSDTQNAVADFLGYSDTEAAAFMTVMPVEIACGLSSVQARYLAQAFSEYGIEVTIVDENDSYVDLTDNTSDSLFSNTGALLASAAAVLGTISIANRVTNYRRYKRRSILDWLFRPKIRRPEPVKPRRHHIERVQPRIRRPRPASGPNSQVRSAKNVQEHAQFNRHSHTSDKINMRAGRTGRPDAGHSHEAGRDKPRDRKK